MRKLADHLRKIPKKSFDMSAWINSNKSIGYIEEDATHLRKAHKNHYKCGMAACVGGHAQVVFPRLLRSDSVGAPVFNPTNSKGVIAMMNLLEICENHAFSLTMAGAKHKTPKAAARYIRDLIKKNPECCRG